jgi:hypothetical protein
MKVLVVCEESQIVCKAFREKGHEAYSCDISPCSGGHPEWHLQMDAFEAIEKVKPDLLIAHPPCTYISQMSYCRWREPGRVDKAYQGFGFAMRLFNTKVPRIAMENPRGRIEQWFKPASQILHPHHFGHKETKATCLWLKNLPPLIPTTPFNQPAPKVLQVRKDGTTRLRGFVDTATAKAGKTRQQVRSQTFEGIAKAMADQWG